MEAETTKGWNVAQYNYKLDKGLTNVMPDHWEGHARVAIWESDVPEKIAEKATRKAIALADDKGVTPESAAKSLIKSIEKQMD
jgi:hypothetical protein